MKKSEIINNFQELLERNYRSEATRKTYLSYAKRFVYDKHPTDIQNLSNDYLIKYLTDILNIDHVSMYNQLFSVLKLLYCVVLKQKHKLKNEKPIKQERKLKQLPVYEKVLFSIGRIKNLKHRAILSVLLSTGVRMNELLNIKIYDVDSANKRILVRNGKGGKGRYVPLVDELLVVLREYYSKYHPKERLFEGVNGKYSSTSVNKMIKSIYGDKCHAHIFRHLFVTYMINKGVNIKKLKQITGHKSDRSLEWYYVYTPESIELEINPLKIAS
jgi:integrase